MPKAISLFDYTGNMLKPWAEAGYECVAFDIQHSFQPYKDKGVELRRADLSNTEAVRRIIEGLSDIAFVSAFPPCDHLAVSGARWFRGKGLRALETSIGMFASAVEICEASGAPYLIENPVSTISTYWRKPDFTFHPFEFAAYEPGDNYTKKTCLWAGGGFVMPEKAQDLLLGEPDDRIHKAPPGPDRANMRSATPMGFARAVFEANHPRVAQDA